MDIASPEVLEETAQAWEEEFSPERTFMISALKGYNTNLLMEAITEKMPLGPVYYPKDQITDKPTRFFVTEIIRQHILNIYDQEIPYSTEVIIEYFNENQKTNAGADITRIGAIVYANRQSQKKILIGKNGSKIKQLGSEARKDIERFLDTKIFLELHVKVKEDWRNNEHLLNQFGYQ